MDIATVESAIGASLPLPGLPHALEAGFALAMPAVAAIALTVWKIWRKRETARDAVLKPSPEAYLYQASQFFTPTKVTNNIFTLSRKFG